MPSLPEAHLAYVDPFLPTEIDCVGPITVQQPTPLLPMKTSVVLSTCFVTCAIHHQTCWQGREDKLIWRNFLELHRNRSRRETFPLIFSYCPSNLTILPGLFSPLIFCSETLINRARKSIAIILTEMLRETLFFASLTVH